MKKIMQRVAAPTPPFFRKLRNLGLVLAAAGTAIVTAPVSMPALAITVAGYCIATGSVVTAISQMAVTEDPAKKESSRKKKP